MRELLDTYRAWRADDVEIGRAVVVRTFGSAPRPEGAVLLAAADGRIAGSVSGGCVEGAAYEEIERARRDGVSRVIRYGISDEQAWDVGLACGGTIDVLVEPLVRPEMVAASGDLERGRAVITPLPADSPGPAFGPHEPGARGGAARWSSSADDRLVERVLGVSGPRRRARSAALAALDRGESATVELGGRSLFVEAYPVRPRLVVVGAVQVAIPLVALRPGARLRDDRHRRPGRVRHAGPFPGRGSADRGLAGRGRRRDRPRAAGCGGGPHPRREVRRAGDRRGAPARLPLRWRGRLAQDPGGSARAAPGRRPDRSRARSAARSGRPRPGRPGAGRDGAGDHGRGGRRTAWRSGRPMLELAAVRA